MTWRAGIVGASATAERHVVAVKQLAGEANATVELVGIADLDAARAQGNADAWGTIAFRDLDALVAAGANVIHVASEPPSRARLAIAALERGCHVLIESPPADTERDARAIGELARSSGLVATVAHGLKFEPQVKRALDAARGGSLGEIVSVDIVRAASYPAYEGGALPAWYRDAGSPFRDLGGDCLQLIQELLGSIDGVDGEWRTLGGDPNLAFDDWRARVRCANGVGQVQLTWSAAPAASRITIHGTRRVSRVELAPKSRWRRLWKTDAPSDHGVRELYRRLDAGVPPAVGIDDAAEVVAWVDKVARAAAGDHASRLAKFPRADRVPFLVTGASGSLGKAVIDKLRADGHAVRAFQRRIPETARAGVEYAFGNLGDPVAVERAVAGAEFVIHAGAAMTGGWAEHKGGTVIGTQNVIDACKKHGTSQLVYVSSMSVLDWAGTAEGRGTVDEDAPLEPRSGDRGVYTRAKLEAEQLVSAAARQGLPAVILRPGQIFGGGIPLINGAVARRAAGRWLVLGDGKLELPLVYIDDVVDAIVAAVANELRAGEIIQIIDPDHLTQDDVLELAGGDKKVIRVPRPLVFALGRLSELPLGAIGKPSPIGVYRLKSALARLHYESGRASKLLGWRPRVGVREGIKRVAT